MEREWPSILTGARAIRRVVAMNRPVTTRMTTTTSMTSSGWTWVRG